MRIAVDAMGGDHAPDEIVRGALLYRASGGAAEIVLVGDPARLHASDGIGVEPATEVVEMGEHPGAALRRRGDTSIAVATRLVREGKADGVVSAGNTGATMAAALLILGRVRGIDRPALCGMLPTTKGGPACLLDAGATMDATAQNILQFARMASRFMERVHGVPSPSVGLLNVGEEPEKGGRIQLEAHELLRGAADIRFYGNVEGRDILHGTTDIVVTDGFTGNTVAKAMEGVLDVMTEGIRRDIFGGAGGKVAALVALPGIRRFRARMDYEPYVSAPLLGVNGVSVVTHGRARARMLKLAIDVAERSIASGLIAALGVAA
ncbi:MAG: phosphate acyltransferase PlsX [Chloroflexota bacterium]|nr:phosphate acyltransferase PlsX [Chloroflexota bacterium]MDE3192223.1 phosphate acyltransferase PlsX [Chloroflexota bacterium]